MLLDLFFSAAVPFMIICIVVAKVARAVLERKGVYQTPEGEARRDAINKKHHTNRGAFFIAVIFLLLWALMLYELIQRWGAIFFTFAVGILMVIPFMAVCAAAIAVYMFTVHGVANAKSKQPTGPAS